MSGPLSEAREREELASRYIRESGKRRHWMDCATSVAPAEVPGPCDCTSPQDGLPWAEAENGGRGAK